MQKPPGELEPRARFDRAEPARQAEPMKRRKQRARRCVEMAPGRRLPSLSLCPEVWEPETGLGEDGNPGEFLARAQGLENFPEGKFGMRWGVSGGCLAGCRGVLLSPRASGMSEPRGGLLKLRVWAVLR